MFFRSETMNYYEMRVSYESAWAVIGSLGTLSALQIEDSNAHVAAMNRPFINYLKRCTALQDRVQFMEELLIEQNKPIIKTDEYVQFCESVKDGFNVSQKTGDAYLDDLENEILSKHTLMKRNNESMNHLKDKLYDLIEQKQVYTLTQPILPSSFHLYLNAATTLDKDAQVSTIQFCYICGVIKAADFEKFQKLIYRISRGNSFLKVLGIPLEKNDKGEFINCEFDEHKKPIQKNVFFLAFPRGTSDALRGRLVRLCDSFGVRKYNLPSKIDEMKEEVNTIENEILNFLQVKDKTLGELEGLLKQLSDRKGDSPCSLIEELRMRILRERCIYENFDKMKLKDRIFYARVWIPVVLEPTVRRVISSLGATFNFNPPELEFKNWEKMGKKPPTFFRTNEFTKPYLEIVETYGIPRYQEMNPAPWSIATFPYQFGVMFGDVGHGGLLFAATSYLVYKAEEFKITKAVPKKLLEVRYLFFLMGFFAFYCGFIYNEFFAITLKYFTSCYNWHNLELEDHHCVYPIGLDSAWYSAKNEVSYFNSFKMKLSIIIGVLHMMMGIFLRGANNVYFKSPIDFVFEFIPQVVFMSCTFGYMCVCIVIKWTTDWTGRTPPSILNVYTSMGITVNSISPDS
jgi:V-type H+-transporting ATPase subunit a